jgi:GAF domain-containing protein
MELLPHTKEALDEYLDVADPDLEGSLMTMGDSAARIVPDCVGLSLTLYDEDDLTFTLVASDLPTAELDAMKYLDEDEAPVIPHPRDSESWSDLLDEDRWAVFARASAAAGVGSTLSLPIVDDDRVVGGINIYAASEDAFAGRQRDLAEALGASATGAVANADLTFESRRRAEEAPRQLRDQRLVEVGTGILAAREGLEVEVARRRIEVAAQRAGITPAQAATVIIRVQQG